jgi:dienelactone hydrolase
MAVCTVAAGQLAPPRSLEELKAEVQARADRHAYPLSDLQPEEVREALAGLHSLGRDDWAAAWSAIGDRHAARAMALAATDTAAARREYEYAFAYDLFARFPLENSPGKVRAYQKALEAFAAYAKLLDPPLEVVQIPFEGKTVTGYLRLPRVPRPAPVVISVGGLDSRKETGAVHDARYLEHGIGFFDLDMPGTGQTQIPVEPGAERLFSAIIDALQAMPQVDGKRIALYGGSWGGHWSARVGFTERERLRGVVVQGGPVHAYFQPEWQRKALGTREYLFELFEARSAVYGTPTLESFLAYGPRLSLAETGGLDRPSAPMLLINGVRDSQVPIEDLFALLGSGSPKEAWVNPGGGHMGRSREISDEQIFQTVTLPWLVRRLGGR